MKKLAIVGAQERTRNNAPFDNPEYDIWVVSNWANAEWAKRVDAVIEVHNQGIYKNHPKDPAYWYWLQNNETATVYMQYPDKSVPRSVEMPIEELQALTDNLHVLGQSAQVINSSIAFALALAIHLGYEQIDIYGVEMAASSEYRSQQPIFAFWVGYAAGKGIKLNVNCTEGLFIQPLYGYESMYNNEELHNYLSGLKEQEAETMKQKFMIDGAMQIIRQLIGE